MKLTPIYALLLLITHVSALVRRGAPANAPDALKCSFMIDFDADVDGHAVLKTHFEGKGVLWQERTSVRNKFANFVSVRIAGDCQDASLIFHGIPGAKTFSGVTSRKLAATQHSNSPPLSDAAYHTSTGVNDARQKLGLTGKGITVAIIDTGVYYLHPALGGGIGPGFKVIGGYDLVGDDYSDANQVPVPDDDPIDNCSEISHGTHVSGIVAGDARNMTAVGFVPAIPFTGVAYEAKLLAYRVFGCTANGTATDIIAAAIYRAAADGAHIINLSLGTVAKYADEPEEIAADIVSKYGHVVVSAVGNSGAQGVQMTSSPSNAKGALAVASFQSPVSLKPSVFVDGGSYPCVLGNLNASFTEGQVLEIVVNDIQAYEKRVENDGQTNINPGAKGKALLLRLGRRDVATSTERCRWALAAGAVQCILYEPTDSAQSITGNKDIPCMMLGREAAVALLSKIAAGEKPQVVISLKETLYPLQTAGSISNFSSPGLSLELDIKPELGAIGGNVYSTISEHSAKALNLSTAFKTLSGTSMASPYAAGVMALLMQHRASEIPSFNELRGYLMNTASPKPIYQNNLTHSVAYQGAGLVNAFYAASTKSLVLPAAIALNDTDNFKSSVALTIRNNDDITVTYSLSYFSAATVNAYLDGDDFTQDANTTTFTDDQHASVSFKRDFITIMPKAFAKIDVTFTAPAAQTAYPIYSGYIRVVASNQPEHPIHVPYAGLVGSYKNKGIWSRNSSSLATKWGGPLGYPPSIVKTGLYSPTSLTPLRDGDTINATVGVGVMILVSTTSRFASFEILAQGQTKQNKVLEAAGFNTSDIVLIQFKDETDEDGVPGMSVPLVRDVIPDGTDATEPGYQIFFGRAYNSSGYAADLPPGEYVIKFSALRNFVPFWSANEGDMDVIVSPTFKLVTGVAESSSARGSAAPTPSTNILKAATAQKLASRLSALLQSEFPLSLNSWRRVLGFAAPVMWKP
ncbi:hypothetical protein HDU80_000120 [Chytriomyces hyalinus]|nr:hypothetical protein HDU80_000120 [Chytriomyces hyalinus]